MRLHWLPRSFALLCCAVFATHPAVAQQDPAVTGVVTDPGTPTLFQVNALPVACTPAKTVTQHGSAGVNSGQIGCPQHTLGESLTVYGSTSRHTHIISAETVRTPSPSDTSVAGSALIDRVLKREGTSVTVRADGYVLQVTAATQIRYEAGLKPGMEAFQTNQWIDYAGKLHPDGQVSVDHATLAPNVISDHEDKLRQKGEFDPATVSEADRQSAAGRFFFGVDRKRVPAAVDPDLQARVDALGSRLVPAYQRDLPPGDPSSINFRFQLVQEKKYTFYTLPSGIILISHDAAAMANNDAQLAFLLSLAIAEVLQKQELRAQPTQQKMLAGDIAGAAVGLVIPGASLVPLIADHKIRQRMARQELQQNSREALCLMHDAGFDLRQAPVMVARLTAKPGASAQPAPVCERAQYLYTLLGTIWNGDLGPVTPEMTEPLRTRS